jgi:hypothetical protein
MNLRSCYFPHHGDSCLDWGPENDSGGGFGPGPFDGFGGYDYGGGEPSGGMGVDIGTQTPAPSAPTEVPLTPADQAAVDAGVQLVVDTPVSEKCEAKFVSQMPGGFSMIGVASVLAQSNLQWYDGTRSTTLINGGVFPVSAAGNSLAIDFGATTVAGAFAKWPGLAALASPSMNAIFIRPSMINRKKGGRNSLNAARSVHEASHILGGPLNWDFSDGGFMQSLRLRGDSVKITRKIEKSCYK